jgi:hypothetical protein
VIVKLLAAVILPAVVAMLSRAHPTVDLVFGIPSQDPSSAALARAGLARVIASGKTCYGTDYTYAPSPTLLDIAKHRGWRVSRPAPDETEIMIPVGSYAYVPRSLSIEGSGPSWVQADFAYRLKPNANLQTLLFIAPARAWSIQGTPGFAGDDAVTDALHVQTGKISLQHTSTGWARLEQVWHAATAVAGAPCVPQ